MFAFFQDGPLPAYHLVLEDQSNTTLSSVAQKVARKPVCQSKEAALERTGKALTALPVIPKSPGCTEYVPGSLERKLTVMAYLQGLGLVSHHMHFFMNYCFQGKLEVYIPKALLQGHSVFFKKGDRFGFISEKYENLTKFNIVLGHLG